MTHYNAFASFYDKLTANVSYSDRAEYFKKIIEQNKGQVELLLDLACGTGSLSIELSRCGYEVIGVDYSPEMLSIAMEKSFKEEQKILFLCQDIRELDLYGTIDVAVSALDSINHITNKKDVQKVFDKVSLFLDPDGVFIFDMNSIYKHREVLSNNTFIIDEDDIYCAWQNSFDEKTNTVDITLDFFEHENGVYYRSGESFSERAYSIEETKEMLLKAGLEIISLYEGDSFNAPTETSERLVYVTRKVKS